MPIQTENKPSVVVSTMYSTADRASLRSILHRKREELGVGMHLFHSHVVRIVDANRTRIFKDTGEAGIYVDQLSVRNMYHFFDGRRTEDERVAILHAYAILAGLAVSPIVTVH